MGLLFSSFDAKVLVQLEGAPKKYVVYCSRCRRRLLPVGCQAIPKERIEDSVFMQHSFIRCTWCDKKVEVVGDAFRWDGALSSKDSPPTGMRPLSIAVCGLYKNAIDRTVHSLEAALHDGPELTLQRLSLRRSTLRAGPEGLNLPTDVLFLVHNVCGARTPLTDDSGLYTPFLEKAWEMCAVVVLLLLDVPFAYLQRLLEEQPTLQWLLIRRRFIPVIVNGSQCTEDSATEDDVNGRTGVATDDECGFWFPSLVQRICTEQPKKYPLVLGDPVPDIMPLSSQDELIRSWLCVS